MKFVDSILFYKENKHHYMCFLLFVIIVNAYSFKFKFIQISVKFISFKKLFHLTQKFIVLKNVHLIISEYTMANKKNKQSIQI